jgi:paraquat-inducible protein B
MAVKTNPKLIGAFVLGAIALLIVGILAIGGGKFFQRTIPVVMFFPRSVAGLNIGAPVTFRGVRLGEVTNVFIGFDPKTRDVLIPVLAEIYPQRVVDLAGPSAVPSGRDLEVLRDYIENRGLRAQLTVSSLVTGQLVVNLDFFPFAAVGRNDQMPNVYPDRIEIPTIPSTLEEVQATLTDLYRKISKLPLEEMIADARSVLQGTNRLVNDPRIEVALSNVSDAAAAINGVATSLEQRAGPLISRAETAVTTANTAFGAIRDRAEQTRPLIQGSTQAVEDMRKALTSVQQLTKTANGVIDPSSPMNFELLAALREVTAAARSLRTLANMIERNPNAVIFGRPAPQEARRP